MVERSCHIKVRYGETDQMGIVNNANYPSYYEIGRTEWLSQLGLSYQQMEKEGIMMPLIDLYSRYLKPAYYEDELTITTIVKELPVVRMKFDYAIYNQEGILINEGYSQQAFINAYSRRPQRTPQYLIDLLLPYFEG